MLRVLRALARLALLRPVRATDLAIGHGGLAGLIALAIAFEIALGWLATDPPRAFSIDGLDRQCLWILLTLGLAWRAAREAPGPAPLLPLAAALVGTLPARDLLEIGARGVAAATGGSATAELGPVALWIFFWRLALVARAIELCTGLRTLRSASLCGLYATVVWALATQLPSDDGFWWTNESDARLEALAAEEPIDAESLLHGEAARVATAVGELAPQRPGVSDLYLLSFAADSTQGVFRREVDFVQQLFDERFDTSDRSLVLVNSEETAFQRPLASASNLGDALAALGGRMDPAEDVLFLFLTGHGRSSGRVVVRFPPLPLNDLTPARLAQQLDASGIRFRVIVVSACYAGTFLEPLRGDDTLVITASSADRRSFGCSDDAEMTDLGRAFFAEALRRQASFPAAFESARAAIAERELARKLTPSDPQMALGPGIAAKLGELEARAAAPPSLPTTAAR